MNKTFWQRGLIACCVWGVGSALAHAELLLDDADFLSELPVVLTVTHLPQNVREVPAGVTVIDRRMIEMSGAVELADLFRLVPGFQVGHYHGPDGSRTIVTAHGFSDQYARRMQVLIDGRSVYTPLSGGAEWPDLPLSLEDVERIEVIRGPNAATYGANAMAGVINIITRHPVNQQGTLLSQTVGERGFHRSHIRHAAAQGKLHYRISGEFEQSPGYQNYYKEGFIADDSLTRKLSFRGDYRPAVNDYFTLQLGVTNGNRGVGDPLDTTNPVRDRDLSNDYQHLGWQRIFDTDTELNLNLSRQHHKVDDVFKSSYSGFNIDERDLGWETTRYNLDTRYRFRLGETVRMVTGLELRQDNVSSGSYFDRGASYTLNSQNVSLNTEWRPTEQWILHLGNLTERHPLMGTKNSPRVGVNYLYGDGYFVRAATARAYRIPSLWEDRVAYNVYVEGVHVPLGQLYTGYGDLKPERLDSIELAIGMQRQDIGYDLRIFRNQYRDVISTARHPKPPQPLPNWGFVNGGSMDIDGIEFQLRLEPQVDTFLHLTYSQAYAKGWRIDRFDPTDPSATEITLESISVPDSTIGLLLGSKLGTNGEFSLGYYHVSPVRLMAGNLTDGVDAIDLHYRHRFRVGDHQGQWRVLLRDVNGSYFTFRKEVWRDRQAFFNLSLNF